MFTLTSPWVLMALPLALVVFYGTPRVKPGGVALQIPFYQELAAVLSLPARTVRFHWCEWALGLSWILLIIALAGPCWIGPPRFIARDGYHIMLALDISGSMTMQDMMFHGHPTSRLNVVKYTAEQFVKDRAGDEIGLILFGSRAYLMTPLTYDRQTVLHHIHDVSAGLAGNTTSIGDALGLSLKHLEQLSPKGRVIILLTDGVSNSGVLSPMKAAELASAMHIKIYTIGLSADARVPLNVWSQNNQGTDVLDEATLKKIAKMTDGHYFKATDGQSLNAVYQTINQLEKMQGPMMSVRPRHEYYVWPLGLAFILLSLIAVSATGVWRVRGAQYVE